MLVLLGLIGLCIVLTASSVSAASTVYVNATGGSDSNNGTIDHPYQTIYQGISSVDENGTVKIADGVYTGTNNTNITITKNVNINGQSQTGTIINGTGINWIFNIPNGINVTIQNLTITNANKNDYGSAISNLGNLTVNGCSFTANTNSNTYPVCAGIYNGQSGVLKVVNSNFRDNIAGWSCTILNMGVCTVENSTFINNTATTNGGAIGNDGTLNVTGSTFIGNHADNLGGAIVTDPSSHIEIHYCSLIGNTASMGNVIYNQGYLNATDNWWGSNNPVWTDLIAKVSGTIDNSTWLYMTMNAIPPTINNTQTSLVTVSFNNRDNGNTVTAFDPSTGHIPDGTLVTFTSTLGSFTPITVTTVNGIATAVFTAKQTGTGNLTATTDNQTVTQLLTVNPTSYLYLNTTTSKKNPTTGETFILTYKLSNSGPDNATNVIMSFQIPTGLEFVNATVDNGTVTYNPANRTVTWTLDNVAVGDPYLYLTVRALGSGSYSITPKITSETFNGNTDPLMPFSISVQAQNNSNGNTVNAASTTKTVSMQTTGMPIAGLVLAILAVLGGVFTPRKK